MVQGLNALVYGDARLIGEVVAEEELNYNGKDEYERAARQLYEEVKREMVDSYFDCAIPENNRASVEGSVVDCLDGRKNDWKELYDISSMQMCAYKGILKAIKPSALDLILQLGLGLASALKLSLYARSILKIAERVRDIKSLNTARSAKEEVVGIMNDYIECYRRGRANRSDYWRCINRLS